MAERTTSRQTVFSWALFDFANSAFTTLVVTFIYSTYFAKSIAPTMELGTQYWSVAISTSAVLIAALSPFLGTLADRSGHRKRFLLIATITAIAMTSSLYFPLPGQVILALTLFVIANVSVEMAQVFYNAYLPEISTKANVGKISGYGWGLGYVGGLLCLGLALALFVQPETPIFGLSKESGENIRATNLLVSGWFALFCIPTFLYLRDSRKTLRKGARSAARETVSELSHTLRHLGEYRQIVRFLIARLFYNDALVTLIGFGGIYAAGTFGFTFEEILIFGIVLNVAAAFGAVAFGFIDDKIGGKKTVVLTIVGFVIATTMVVTTQSKSVFWAAGVLMGILIGPNQSASRSLFARFVPASKETEFFGFFALSGKLTAFMGPLLLGILTRVFASQRAGLSVLIVEFLIGLAILLTVNEREGLRSGQDNPGAMKD